MRHPHRFWAHILALAVITTACTSEGETEKPETLTLIAHDSFASAAEENEAFAAFTASTGIAVDVVAAGDAGALVNQAVLSKDNPLADVLFGIDDTFLSRAVDEGIFQSYQSAHIDAVPEDLRHEDDLVTPIDFGDVCFNYDKAWFEANEVEVPDDLSDLTDPEYAQNVTVEHPATSSPGLAFLLATIDAFGEDEWLQWWEQMRDAGINVANDWETAYYSDFTRHGGASPIVMSYASSPPAEVIFADEPPDTAPTGVIESGCYRQVEFAGILDGTDYPESSGELIDYMLSVEFQETVPLTWFVFPANQEAELPEEFVEHTIIPESPARLPADEIAENRDRWIDEWVSVMGG